MLSHPTGQGLKAGPGVPRARTKKARVFRLPSPPPGSGKPDDSRRIGGQSIALQLPVGWHL